MSDANAAAPSRRFGAGALLLVLALGLAGGAGAAWFLQRPGPGGDGPAAKAEAKTVYTCPMHPTIVSDHPGDCPICGMALVKAGAAEAGGHGHGGAADARGLATVAIDPQRQQLIGLRTTEATRGPVGESWRTVGKVAVV